MKLMRATADNACSAIARIIVRYNNSLPLPQLLPLFFRALPLREDHLEDEYVYNCLFFLFQQNNAVFMGNLEEIRRICQEASATNSGVDDMIKQNLQHMWAAIHST